MVLSVRRFSYLPSLSLPLPESFCAREKGWARDERPGPEQKAQKATSKQWPPDFGIIGFLSLPLPK